jgi:membrane-bound serine protease (ClpP class)
MGLVITLLVVGAILMILEIYLPGLVAGILGLICLAAGVVAGYYELGPVGGTWLLIGTVAGLLAGFACWLWLFPRTPMGRAFISENVVGEIGTERPDLLGQSGVAFTQLRPSGTALINGQRVDVVTEGALIAKGAPLKVVAVEGMRVVVRAQGEASGTGDGSSSNYS